MSCVLCHTEKKKKILWRCEYFDLFGVALIDDHCLVHQIRAVCEYLLDFRFPEQFQTVIVIATHDKLVFERRELSEPEIYLS